MNRYEEILKKYWGYDKFRSMQLEIIESIGEGKDTLGLLPTGGGKSIIFQVAALAKEGICIVITPLIALMKDQVENLRKYGIKALAVYSGMSKREIAITLDNAVYGDFKFLYLSPERLYNAEFRKRLSQMNVNLFTVDEAHCISQWGYDFRPSYMKIAEVRNDFPNVPILALTATATPKVVEDIQTQLQFKQSNVFQKSFVRDNLIYMVRNREDKNDYLVQTIKKAKGTGVVYVRNRRKTREIAQLLQQNGVSADFYHAGLDSNERSTKQDNWKQDKTRVIVSTNAFGMGIDKADVRFVIHVDTPDSLEAYFQEAGRAGRDGKRAVAVLLASPQDRKRLLTNVSNNFPEKSYIQKTYNSLCNFFQVPLDEGEGRIFTFRLKEFAKGFGLNIIHAHNSLKLIQKQGYIEYIENITNPSRVKFIIKRDDLYRFQVENENFDGFIRALLRTYSGLFSESTGISEELLSKRTGLPIEKIVDYLVTLSQRRIITYYKENRLPMIIFLRNRVTQEKMIISKENYSDRKVSYEKQVKAVLNYSESNTICRSQLLVQHFGQKKSEPCGRCDVCISGGSDKQEESTMRLKIFDLIAEKEMTILKLKEHFVHVELLSKVVTKLLAEEEIFTDQNGFLRRKS